jgi:hypothetical protein
VVLYWYCGFFYQPAKKNLRQFCEYDNTQKIHLFLDTSKNI